MSAVILTGGAGTRMGGRDKGLLELDGRPLIEFVLDILEPRVEQILISANRNLTTYRRYGIAVISDDADDRRGPLAGVASALAHCRGEALLSLPVDSPFLPAALPARLLSALEEKASDASIATYENRAQPVFAALRPRLLPALRRYLDSGQRKAEIFYNEQSLSRVDCTDWPDAFLNLNTPQDWHEAERRLRLFKGTAPPPP